MFVINSSGQIQTAAVGKQSTVAIPVTVTGKDGVPSGGIGLSAFSVLVGDQKQQLDSATEVPPLVAGKNKSKVAFVLLDAIASPPQLQANIRKECLQLLSSAALAGMPVSLSEIDRAGLRVVHELTTPNSTLAAALLTLDNDKPFLSNKDQLRLLAANANAGEPLAAEIDRLRRFRKGEVELANRISRLSAQLEALQQIATALQHAPGRKTVLWLTGYFQVDISEYFHTIYRPFPKSVIIDYQQTIDLLNAAQISVFPVQVSESGNSVESVVVGNTHSNLDRATTDSLRDLAQSTGGEEMLFTDTVDNLVRRAEDRTTTYYLLKFTPESSKSDIAWKPLRVQVNVDSVDLKAPRGMVLFPDSK
jgi:VWFA-related protein